MNDTLTVAAIQARAVAGDIDTNVTTAVDAIRVAAGRGARVVVFPELFLSGYAMAPVSISADDPRLAPLRAATAKTGVVAIMGAAMARRTGKPTIGLLTIDADVRHAYDKQYLCGAERDHFAAGLTGTILEVDGWRLALAVCYDGCFPDHAQAAATAGADAYVASIAYYEGSAHRRDLYYRARALDNGMYAVVSGLFGECAGERFNGGTAVVDPEGRTIAAVPDDDDGIAIATLQRSLIAATREAHPMGADRRTDLSAMNFVTAR